jgi:hypothetical protein
MADWRLTSSSSRFLMLIYIDPGAGSMVIQAILATALAIPFFFRTQISRVVQRFRDPRGSRDETPPTRD